MSNIVIAAPIRPSANSGNDVTATRWSRLLQSCGHQVDVLPVDESIQRLDGATMGRVEAADVLIALHARRSANVASWWTDHKPTRPLIVGLSGTDLYQDMPANDAAMSTVARADALLVLQDDAKSRLQRLEASWAEKTHIVYQSLPGQIPDRQPSPPDEFRIVVLAHLRDVKDPLLASRAARLLPTASQIMVHHAGRAHDERWRQAASDEVAHNPRYVWHRELDATAALELLASADALACTSRSEGGANVVTEAIALGVPVIGTEIGGNIGLLGADHPGWFPAGDAAACAGVLTRLEHDDDFLGELTDRSLARQHITRPDVEAKQLAAVIKAVESGR